MREDILSFITNEASKNSIDGISPEKIRRIVEETERELGYELSGYATIDKPYNQFYTPEMLRGYFPHQKISTEIIQRSSKIKDQIAFRCEKNFTYGELIKETIRFAYVLKNKYKISSGDKIIMDVLSTPDSICAFLAANLIGAQVRPIDPIYGPDQIKKIVYDYEPKLIISNTIQYSNIKDIVSEFKVPVSYISLKGYLPFLPSYKKQLIMLLEKANVLKIKKESKSLWNDFSDDIKSTFGKKIKFSDVAEKYVPNQIAAIFPTSGTTGEAKGVEVTNENFLSNVYKEFSSELDIKDGDSLFNPMPTCSSFFWYTIALAAFLGVTTSLSPLFDAKASPKQISEDESSWVLLGPIIINELCNYIESYDSNDSSLSKIIERIEKIVLKNDGISSIEKIKGKSHYISGGDLLSLDLEKRAKALGLEINNNLGTSENTGPSTNPNGGLKNHRGYYEGSVGICLPGNDMAIFGFDEENDSPDFDSLDYEKGLKYFEIGEICFSVNNANVFHGYFANPSATNQAKIEHRDGSYWYHSGDLGYMDPAGHVFVCGRKSGLIVRDGHKVWAPKIEKIAKKVKGIKDCAIIGVPDVKEKETPACFIVFDDDVNEGQKNKIVNLFYSMVLESLDEKHIPTYWKELEQIPRNLMTKAKISELNKIYEEDIAQNAQTTSKGIIKKIPFFSKK